jgi:D-alanyl-D-alanine carboxypeptidase/D-alanyl-D-alanine-endopeptidase (penicillin-binding protein 4)
VLPDLRLILSLVLALTVQWPVLAAEDPLRQVLAMSNASLLVKQGDEIAISRQADRPMVPASTMKLVTALAAIDRWGLGHRFHTDFFLSDDGWLWVQGHGDPFLVSEELDLIASALSSRMASSGLSNLRGISTDDHLFAPDVEVAGRSSTLNPYDAPIGALAVNFNTIHVRKSGGRVISAESQTPLTPLAVELARTLGPGKHRINLGERDLAPRYLAELLASKLRDHGIEVASRWRASGVPDGLALFYRHENSRDLAGVISAMMEYSNNFIANNLFLLLANQGDGKALTMSDARRQMHRWIDARFGWTGYRVDDGAGLSRGNRLSAHQLVDVVLAMKPHRNLLSEQGALVRAKTGTLKGVSCYAGLVNREGEWVPFALMINQSVPYRLREQVANQLADAPTLNAYCTEC